MDSEIIPFNKYGLVPPPSQIEVVLARLWNTFDFPFEFGIPNFPELLLNVFGALVMNGCKFFGQHPDQYIRNAGLLAFTYSKLLAFAALFILCLLKQ